VRVNQYLSSNKNAAGDGFTATLTQPLVVDGIVVAQRGQTLGGRVAEAQKAGRVQGVSRLAVELTDMTLVDGTQVPISTQMSAERGPTGKGNDAVIIGTTSGVGAAIGAGAGGGAGAAIGAGGGALAAAIGERAAASRALDVAGPGLFDCTRLALRYYALWRDILATNADYIDRALAAYIQELEHIRENLRTRQLEEEFRRAAALAARLRKGG